MAYIAVTLNPEILKKFPGPVRVRKKKSGSGRVAGTRQGLVITGGWMKVSVGPSHWCQANYCCCCCCCCYRCCTGYQSTVSWREARALLHIDARQQEVMGPGSSLKAAPRSGREEMLSSSKGNRIIQPWWQKYLLGGDKLQIRKFKM